VGPVAAKARCTNRSSRRPPLNRTRQTDLHRIVAGQGEIINLADRRAEASRLAQIDMLVSLGPDSKTVQGGGMRTSPAPRSTWNWPRICISLNRTSIALDIVAAKFDAQGYGGRVEGP
jgi:hypothetical protein